MPTTIEPYLYFDGDCREAMELYQSVLGGEMETMMTYGEGPSDGGDPCPEGVDAPAESWKDRIMHACLLVDGRRLMASDAPPGMYETPGGAPVAVAVNVDGAETVDRIFGVLAEGGKVIMPLETTFWSPRFGMLVDRFGISWLIGCNPQQP